MLKMEEIHKILSKVLPKIRPSKEERVSLEQIALRIKRTVRKIALDLNIEGIVAIEYQGSYAKDTWLSGETDLDLFILYDTSMTIKYLKESTMKIALLTSKMLHAKLLKRYATHPYATLVIGNIEVDIVPAYSVPSPDKIITSVDRTPFHTRYVKKHINNNPRLADEIRLLKKFLKSLGLYGAEIKKEGFSGYLAELIVIYYGGFIESLESISKYWRPWKTYISIEKTTSFVKEKSPLIFIDPVDPYRNVAAAVSLENMSKLIAYSKMFLRKPCIDFFFPTKVTYDLRELKKMLKRRKVLSIYFKKPDKDIPDEVIWGKLKRSMRKIVTQLTKYGFNVFSVQPVVIDDKIAILIELEELELPEIELHRGPPVWSEEYTKFIAKWINDAVAGPFVNEDRWYVLRKRRYRKAVEIIKNLNREATIFPDNFTILHGEDILKISSTESFRNMIYTWLKKRDPWISCFIREEQ